MKSWNRVGWSLVGGALLWIVFSAPVVAQGLPNAGGERQVTGRAVTTWDKGCSGSLRGPWDDMVKYWYDELTDGYPLPLGHGNFAWSPHGFYSDDYMVFFGNNWWTQFSIADSDFTDATRVSWGRDHAVGMVDDADAAMIALHGGNGAAQNSWSARVRIDEPGGGNCDSLQQEMEFGDLDMEFLHLSSCFSMDQEDWTDWFGSYKGVHQIDGFHGIMYIHGDEEWLARYSNFADDAFYTAMSISWLENMYRDTCYYDEDDGIVKRKDQCGVAQAVGNGPNAQADCYDRLFHERYDYVYSDPSFPTYHCQTYIAGCDPSGQPGMDNLGNECDQRPPFLRGFVAVDPNFLADVRRALPLYDSGVLSVTTGPDWPAGQTVSGLAAAVSDFEPSEEFTDGSTTLAQEPDGSLVMRFDTDRGFARYSNRSRQFDWASSSHTRWDAGSALGIVEGMVGDLQIPNAEIADDDHCCRVDAIVGKGTDTAGTNSATDVEQLVTIYREINGLPVHESYIRAAVSNDGEIARVLVRWPRFVPAAGQTLRLRSEVEDEIAGRLQADEFGQSLDLLIHLAYARIGSEYHPVAVVQYDDGVSGSIFLARLTQGAADADLDGTPDATDNCPALANTDQADADGDGRGDRCDNCPLVANPGQEDVNLNGMGDACDVPSGACTQADGTCMVLQANSCVTLGGAYGGDYISCATAGSVPLTVTPTDLSWSQRAMAVSFDVVRGDIGLLRSQDAKYVVATEACLANDHAAATLPYAASPGPGIGWWFLVRENTTTGPGSYDVGWHGQAATRDPGIGGSAAGCP